MATPTAAVSRTVRRIGGTHEVGQRKLAASEKALRAAESELETAEERRREQYESLWHERRAEAPRGESWRCRCGLSPGCFEQLCDECLIAKEQTR